MRPRPLDPGRGRTFHLQEDGVDGATRCTGTASGRHDHVPDPPTHLDLIRTATCHYCGDVLMVTRTPQIGATMTATATLTPRPAVPPPSTPTAAVCSKCKGEGGAWVTNDGKSAGKNIGSWVACKPCKGTGQV
ncbi:hypothetical protein ACFXKD_27925 [Nocardiopsis aegyptia]|uniref:hypothetical protein n=1 Tax=Nocardiopsis aegyptia TaxID=220378 RepID=UPI0036719BB7